MAMPMNISIIDIKEEIGQWQRVQEDIVSIVEKNIQEQVCKNICRVERSGWKCLKIPRRCQLIMN